MAAGRKPRSADPEFLRRWDAVSVFVTASAARTNAEYYDLRPGEYIAELQIPDDVPLDYDGPDETGHYDLYGTQPDVLLGYVTSVVHYTAVPTTPFSS